MIWIVRIKIYEMRYMKQDAAESILEAAEKDIYGSLINEGKSNIDDKQQEDKEKAEEAQE